MKIRLRIEAGIGNTMTDVGYADVDVALPISVTPTRGADGAGMKLTIDTDEIQTVLSAAVEAFSDTVEAFNDTMSVASFNKMLHEARS